MRCSWSLSSVTRWLLVVVGCAGLEPAQPTKAAAPEGVPPAIAEVSPAAPVRTPETVLIPGGAARPDLAPPRATGGSSWLILLGLSAGGAAWWWWRKRVGTPVGRGARARQIEIEESRPLGNRQYLVVAAVAEKRFLLGISPGSIQLLSPLDAKEKPHGPTP